MKIRDVVVPKTAGTIRVEYDAQRVFDVPQGQEDWESISKSAFPMSVSNISDGWVTCMGVNGVYGYAPSELKKVPSGIKTWCGTN